MATKKKKAPKKISKKKNSPIDREISLTGSYTAHKDGSVFIFMDIHNNKEGSTTKNVSLSKAEVGGLKKFFNFLDLQDI